MTTSVYNTVSTELDAINTMLSTIGERPVNSLDDTLPADVGVAMNTLMDTVREVQLEGWHFNTEENYPLPRKSSGEIHLPSGIFRVTLSDPDSHDVVQRGDRLYDRENHTYIFNENITATVSLLLPFEELPEAFRWYITVRAARKFQARTVGSSEQHAFTEEDERDAKSTAKREDTLIGRPSLAKGEATTFISGWTPGQTLRR